MFRAPIVETYTKKGRPPGMFHHFTAESWPRCVMMMIVMVVVPAGLQIFILNSSRRLSLQTCVGTSEEQCMMDIIESYVYKYIYITYLYIYNEYVYICIYIEIY